MTTYDQVYEVRVMKRGFGVDSSDKVRSALLDNIFGCPPYSTQVEVELVSSGKHPEPVEVLVRWCDGVHGGISAKHVARALEDLIQRGAYEEDAKNWEVVVPDDAP